MPPGPFAMLLAAAAALVLTACGPDAPPDHAARLTADVPPGARAPSEPARDDPAGSRDSVAVRVLNDQGDPVGPVRVLKVVRPDAEWRQRLTDEQFRITRRAGTEPAFCGPLLDNDQPGVYACVCCDLPLFRSDAKFDSGTGWPSFFQPIARENIGEKLDRSHGMVRTEIVCTRCDAHLGHVFADGPPPTGRRYCLNSDAMRFVHEDDLRTLADPAARERATAVLAGGCFWCVEAVFQQLDGVVEVVSGYAGGMPETANYRAVTSGQTDHAEAVKVTYNPAVIRYDALLRVFFTTHDPTQLNRQGPDIGRHYRSAVFYNGEAQKQAAEAKIAKLTESRAFGGRPIVTTIEPLDGFYMAEDDHQNFAEQNPAHPYIRAHALPKLEKLREQFPEKLRQD